MKYIPYRGTQSIQAILNSDDLTAVEKAHKIYRHQIRRQAPFNKRGVVKQSELTPLRDILEAVMEYEMDKEK